MIQRNLALRSACKRADRSFAAIGTAHDTLSEVEVEVLQTAPARTQVSGALQTDLEGEEEKQREHTESDFLGLWLDRITTRISTPNHLPYFHDFPFVPLFLRLEKRLNAC